MFGVDAIILSRERQSFGHISGVFDRWTEGNTIEPASYILNHEYDTFLLGAGVAVMDRKLYAVGGFDGVRRLDR